METETSFCQVSDHHPLTASQPTSRTVHTYAELSPLSNFSHRRYLSAERKTLAHYFGSSLGVHQESNDEAIKSWRVC